MGGGKPCRAKACAELAPVSLPTSQPPAPHPPPPPPSVTPSCRDDKLGQLDESKPKQLFTPMPVMLMRAVPAEKEPKDNIYQCPVYIT